MMEVMENVHMDDIEIPVKTKTVSFAEVEQLESDSDDIVYSEDTQLETENTTNKKSVDGPHIHPSRWSQLARVFRLGLSVDSYQPQTSTKEVPSLLQNDVKSVDKRGSLGKMFRQGLISFPRPISAREDVNSNFGATHSSNVTVHGNERRIKWNIFKHGKSLHQIEGEKSGVDDTTKEEGKKRPLSRLLLKRYQGQRESQEETFLKNIGGTSSQEPLPAAESRVQSLGKFFRHNRNPELLKRSFSKEKKCELE